MKKSLENGPMELAQELVREALDAVGAKGARGDFYESLGGAVAVLQVDTGDAEAAAQAALRAMNHLRRALEILQGTKATNFDPDKIAQTIARSLAILYPISKSAERQSQFPQRSVPNVPGAERRLAKRIAIEADIGFQSESNFFMGFTEDVSEGGIFVATYDLKPIGSSLNINFTLPDGRLVSVDGIVRWLREYNETNEDIMPGMGIQFINLSDRDKDAIHGFTSKRQPLFYEE